MSFKFGESFIHTNTESFDSGKDTVLFLHGAGMNHKCWLTQSNWFEANGLNVVVPSFPGHAPSKGEPLASIEDSASWLEQLQAEMGVPFDYLVGHSQGFLTAIEFVARHQKVVKGLVGVASALSIPVNSDLVDLAKSSPLEAAALMLKWGVGESFKEQLEKYPTTLDLSQLQQQMAESPLGVDLMACANVEFCTHKFARGKMQKNK